MDHELDKADSKAKYEPPRLTVISLRPEEAVLGHCKTMTTGGGPGASPCFPLCGSSLGS
jgi:hypothetical protein